MYKLSIIIPIYNVEKYLTECLESVLAQDSKKIEVIMVNDYSTDGSREIAASYKEKFHNATLIDHDSNQGLGPARNTAIKAAQGDYLMMLDSDDWLELSAVNILLKKIDRTPFDLLQYGCNKVHQQKVESNLYIDFPTAHNSLKQKQNTLLSIPNYAWLKLVRREFVAQHSLQFQNIYYEDIPWSIALTFAAKEIVFCNHSLYNYRQRTGSIVYSQSPRHLDLLRAYKFVYSELDHIKANKQLKRALNDAFISAAYYLHLQRKVRLGDDYIDDYSILFKNIVYTYKIYPSSLRSLAMLSLVFIKLAINK